MPWSAWPDLPAVGHCRGSRSLAPPHLQQSGALATTSTRRQVTPDSPTRARTPHLRRPRPALYKRQ
eukprot:scaffold18149_cov129-Isochrysis_galbana.AAC.8